MDPIEFSDIGVIPFNVENNFGWRFQVIVGGGTFPVMTISPKARLGAQTIQGIQVSPDGSGFGGYLRDPPVEGDKLFFNYPEQEEFETGLTYREPVE